MMSPTKLQSAHSHSANHRAEIRASKLCGCFYCRTVYPPDKIKDWVDEDSKGEGQTALCPKCGIDSVIGDASGLRLTPKFLAAMHTYWF